jgi:hypothetical protein
MGEPDDKTLTRLNAFSTRAIQVVFAARFKAGQRGANMIEVGDLLLGMVLEDKGMIGNLLSNMHGGPGLTSPLTLPSHSPFFSPEAAGELLTRIETLLPQSEPISHTIEVPLSLDLERAFDGAKGVQDMFHHKQIEPLHLLAGVLTQESSQHFKLLQEVGITKELVLQRLRAKEG